MRGLIKDLYLIFRTLILKSILFFMPPNKISRIEKDKIKRILLIRLDRIGDFVLTAPAIKALKEGFLNAHITIAVQEELYDLAKEQPFIDEVIVLRNSFFGIFPSFRNGRFDLAVDFHMDYPLATALVCFLSGARYRAGYDIAGRGIFFNIKLTPNGNKKHIIEDNLDLARAVGIDVGKDLPKLQVSPEKLKFMRNFLNQKGIEEDNILVSIHTGGYYETQRWLTERFIEVADGIARRYPAKVIIISGQDEENLISKISGSITREVLIIDRLSLLELAALIKHSNLLICNNSGPLHIACALGVPTVSTMGPTLPWRWWPVGENHIVLRKDLPCSPCEKGFCKTHECMKLITVDEMLDAVDRQMKLLVKNRCAESTAQ